MSDIIFLIVEILHRAALILGVIYILDYKHNGKIDLPFPKPSKKSVIYRFIVRGRIQRLLLKLADKFESSLEARRRAWIFRAHVN